MSSSILKNHQTGIQKATMVILSLLIVASTGKLWPWKKSTLFLYDLEKKEIQATVLWNQFLFSQQNPQAKIGHNERATLCVLCSQSGLSQCCWQHFTTDDKWLFLFIRHYESRPAITVYDICFAEQNLTIYKSHWRYGLRLVEWYLCE